MLVGLDPGVVEGDVVVLFRELGPVLHEFGGAEAHEVHVTCCIDGGIPLEDLHFVTFPGTLNRRCQACQTSSNDENIDAAGRVGPERL